MKKSIQKLLGERYFLKKEKEWKDIAKRVSKIYPEIYDDILNMNFLPGTPTLMNAHTNGERVGTLSSCFPMEITDSIDGIFEAIKECATVTKFGGGVGYDFSPLRSSLESVKGIGDKKSSGPLPFISIFNETLDGVSQGGSRRGAGMSMIDIDHPDILKFIKAKEDTSKFNRLNFSIRMSDKFYEILEKNPDSIHKVKTKDNVELDLINDETDRAMTVKDIWNLIVTNVWKNGEPGIFNKDIAYDQCVNTNVSKQVLSNPCLTGDTLIAVPDHRGAIPLIDLVNDEGTTEVYTLNHNGDIEVKPFINPRKTGENQKIYEIEFNTGMKIKCTANHKFLNLEGNMVETLNLKIGDCIKSVNFKERTDHEKLCSIMFSSLPRIDTSLWYTLKEEKSDIYSTQYRKECEHCGKVFDIDYCDRHITFCSSECKETYLSKKYNITKESVFVTVKNIKYSKNEDVYDGTIAENHTILVGGRKYKDDDGKEQQEFVVTSQCSEFVNIPYTSCSLGSIDVSKFATSSDFFDFDTNSYEKLVRLATRFIDKTIDNNTFPLEKIEEVTKKVRPLGLGVMGIAHLLYLCEIPYNSIEGVNFIKYLILFTTLVSMDESVELAKEACDEFSGRELYSGSYDSFDYNLYMKANKRFFEEKEVWGFDVKKLKDKIKKHGIRNSSNTSIAPTGTISFIADTSSGLEPVFALTYIRKIEKENKQYENVYISDPIFENYLDTNIDDKTKQKILKYISENNGSCQGCPDLSEEVQKIFVVAADISPIEHLNMVEVVARGTSLSCSKTVNLPQSATKEDIANVYIEAHKRGVIGLTAYRNNSREGILVHDIKKEKGIEDIIERHAPKRPKVLNCDVHRVTYKGEKWIVFIGLYNGWPFEVFAGKIGEVNIPKSISSGKTIKQKRKHYSFEYDGEILIDNIIKSFSNKEHDAFARILSSNLRHGTPIQFVIDALNKSEGDITNFAKVISRTLKGYVKDGTVSTLKCDSCGGDMRFTEGCVLCIQCGISKCG